MKHILFHKPTIPKETIRLIKETLDSGWITTGPRVKELEKQIGNLLKKEHLVATSSCTAALHTAYKLLNLSPGDEVIVPSFTFCSTVNMIVNIGAKPIFCDIEERSLCADPKDIERKITTKTKAIVVVHFAGYPANLGKINALAKKYGLIVVEDAAHAFGTKYKSELIGSGNNITCFSFYATKNLTTAEGGMVVCNTLEQSKKAKNFINHGITRNSLERYGKDSHFSYDVLFPGFKYNMSDIHACIGIAQLKKIKEFRTKRKILVSKYFSLLKNNQFIKTPDKISPKEGLHAWHLFVIRVLPTAKCSRDDLYYYLKKNGIDTSVHYIPNHQQEFYEKRYKGHLLPVTEKIGKEVISLPLYELLSIKDVSRICKLINKATIYGTTK